MIQVNDRVRYKNILGEWHEGRVIKVNKITYRIISKEFKVVSIKKDNVELLERRLKSV